ncbi:ATP-binding cassette domain-containing protein [Paenibacillus yanchengensis]|uniref:ATP-binding cassette domain-containing protein n=1 Tax=Paenibacillus yanchengensis TaxID=2035833 RepID=A0ABW4YQU8_9BACL
MPLQLQLQHISKQFDQKKIFEDVSFTFEQGKIYGLLGRNGAGKTTLFNCLSEEIPVSSGQALLVDGETTRPVTNHDVGFVYSLPILPEFLTGYEFIKFFLETNRQAQPEHSIADYFAMMTLSTEDQHKLIKSYSHGMKNKLQMLLFLITKPPIILLDEPLTSFDVIVALEMKNLLRNMKHDHIIIFSTHILQLATDLCDELVLLHQGNLSTVSATLLHEPDFEQQIIQLLQN